MRRLLAIFADMAIGYHEGRLIAHRRAELAWRRRLDRWRPRTLTKGEHPMTQPYTDTDVELVARTLAGDYWRTAVDDARAVLSALAAAGRLTPADAETRPEWGWLPAGGREPAPYDEDGARWFVERGHSGTVMRRWRAVGRWLPVPEEEQ